MDVSVYREFLCLARELNFTSAARQCFITQSALSKHISGLENELGCVLFVRSRRGVELTEAGKEFAADINRVFELYDEACSKLERRKSNKTGSLDVGFLSGATKSFLGEVCELFLAESPTMSLKLHTMEGGRLLNSLNTEQLDVIIGMLENEVNTDRYASQVLFDDYYGAAVPLDHPLSGLNALTRRELSQCRLAIPQREKFWTEYSRLSHVFERYAPEAEVVGSISDAIDFGVLPLVDDCLAIMPSHLAATLDEKRLKFVPLIDPYIDVKICAVWRRGGDTSLVEEFVSAMCSVICGKDLDTLRNRGN